MSLRQIDQRCVCFSNCAMNVSLKKDAKTAIEKGDVIVMGVLKDFAVNVQQIDSADGESKIYIRLLCGVDQAMWRPIVAGGIAHLRHQISNVRGVLNLIGE